MPMPKLVKASVPSHTYGDYNGVYIEELVVVQLGLCPAMQPNW